MTHGRSWWLSGVGGAAMLAVTLMPPLLLWFVPGSALQLHSTATSGFDLGAFLSVIPGVAVVALFAPLVGYRRRDAFWMIFPIANLYLAWVFGSRAAHLSAADGAAAATGFSGPTTTVPSRAAR
jgi:hypothetical protein